MCSSYSEVESYVLAPECEMTIIISTLTIWNSLNGRFVCYLTLLFITSVIYILTHRYLFYTLIYNSILYFYVVQIVLALMIRISFCYFLCVILTYSIIVF